MESPIDLEHQPSRASLRSAVRESKIQIPMEQEARHADSAVDPCSFQLLLSCPSGLSPSQVSVRFNAAYDRIPHPDVNLENTIAETWEQRNQKNKSLYNGKKFRYGGYILQRGSESDHEPRVCLHLGLTDYRTFVGTNLSHLWERFLFSSEVEHDHDCSASVVTVNQKFHAIDGVQYVISRLKDDSVLCQHTASPLGNGAIVEVIDKKILVLQRSNNVGEFPGHFVFPGGHPEPHEVGIASHQHNKELTESTNGKVSHEMFDSIVREVVEEIGVPASSLSIPAFIGVSRRELNVRPAAFFYIKCSLNSKEVQQFYSSAQDGYESTQLYAVTMVDLENMASKMPGCHRGGLALYKLMVDHNLKNT